MTGAFVRRRGGLDATARAAAATGTRARPVPAAFGILALVGLLFLVLPTVGLVARAPWTGMLGILRESAALDAMRLSLVTASLSTVVSLILGVPLAWVLARTRSPLIAVVRALALLPLVLPPVGGGVGLLAAFGRRGVVGTWLDRWFGLTLPFSTLAVVMAQTFVAMPFLILTVEGALRGVGTGLEDAAATLGARRWTVLRRVTLPLIAPSLAAGAVLCWARALGEFGATLIFAGNAAGTTRTMPIAVSLGLDTSLDQATALSVVLLVVSLVILVGLRDRWLRAGPAS